MTAEVQGAGPRLIIALLALCVQIQIQQSTVTQMRKCKKKLDWILIKSKIHKLSTMKLFHE